MAFKIKIKGNLCQQTCYKILFSSSLVGITVIPAPQKIIQNQSVIITGFIANLRFIIFFQFCIITIFIFIFIIPHATHITSTSQSTTSQIPKCLQLNHLNLLNPILPIQELPLSSTMHPSLLSSFVQLLCVSLLSILLH